MVQNNAACAFLQLMPGYTILVLDTNILLDVGGVVLMPRTVIQSGSRSPAHGLDLHPGKYPLVHAKHCSHQGY